MTTQIDESEKTAAEKIADQVASLEARIAKLREKEQTVKADEQLGEKRQQLSLAFADAAREIVASVGMNVPAVGMTITLKPSTADATQLDVSVSVGSKKGTRAGTTRGKSGNGIGRTSLKQIGYKSFTLADGSEVKSPAGVLDHYGHPHQAAGSGDAAHREILRWVRDNAAEADKITVTTDDGQTLTLKEAAEALGVKIGAVEAKGK